MNFADLDIPIPKITKMHSIEEQVEIYEYLKQLNDINLKTYLIAINHLGSSFNIYRSNGFKEWKNNLKY
jgi:hypothetical protein